MNPVKQLLSIIIVCWPALTAFAQPATGESLANDEDTQRFFVREVRPLLQKKCFGCHGDDQQGIEGELDLTSREGFLKGGETGKPALIPGKPDDSLMFRAILRTDKMKMPPKDRNALSTEEIEVFRRWIAAGAPWSDATAPATPIKWNFKAEDIWAFQPVKKVAVPEIRPPQSVTRNPIDAFVQEKLHAEQLQPARLADKATLIRRASLDLTGLLPEPKEVDAFIADESPDAFGKVIERLLASPHYGEKMARHWLDVVRYADTDGFSNDYERPNAWRYRDYVIRSFNADKPYDRFVIEQLAGDELAASQGSTPDPELLIAVGMLRMGPWEQTAMSVVEEQRQLFLDDVTASVGSTYLGLTTACAKCHDHKFDPISAKDYYRLQSCFAPAQFELPGLDFLPGENTSRFDQEKARVQDAIKSIRARQKEFSSKRDLALREWLKEKGYKTLKEVPARERPQKDFGITKEEGEREKVLRKRIEYLEREMQRFKPQAFSVANKKAGSSDAPPLLHILIGGALETPGEPVTPGVLSAVYNSDDSKTPSDWNTIPQETGNRRLKLAQWIASSDNPLAARVMVNRVWQWHFGKGLVKSSNNFGKMGDKPTHPELLDWLSVYFIEHGWSVKEMHRLILRSHTYQQSSVPHNAEALKKADPEEKLLGFFAPRRLTAEELRDNMLRVAGELNDEMGGPPVLPEMNLEAALQPRRIMGSVAPVCVPSFAKEQRNRRTIYAMQIRSLMNPMLEVFNAAPTDNSCERRDETTVTPQVFALFNSQSAHDAALAMASRLAKSGKAPAARVALAFQLAYGRQPSRKEEELCLKHLHDLEKHHRTTAPVDFSFPEKVIRSMVGEFTGESFDFDEQLDMSKYEYNLRPSEVNPETRALADLCLVLLNSHEFVYVY
ncbi:MAG: DUF1553 domain-containing protein [Verrucomicrobia bacterium]|nr:DUF1553 domain-containing protein [Verrucomicrobiota bacterium]